MTNHEVRLLLNDIERMSDSLIKLVEVARNECPNDSRLLAQGSVDIQRGTAKVINSINL